MAPTRKNRKPVRLASMQVKIIRKNGMARMAKIPLKCSKRNSFMEESSRLAIESETVAATRLDDRSHHDSTVGIQVEERPTTTLDTCNTHLSPPTSEYQWRKLKEETGWEKVRTRLSRAHLNQQFLESTAMCVECTENNVNPRQAVCRCLDCGWSELLCLQCATKLHSRRNYFHVLELWKDGTFEPLFPNNFILKPPEHVECGTIHGIRSIIIFDQQGRQHLKNIQFCNCQSEAEALVSMGYWPGTFERPKVAFDMRLLDLFNQLLLECHCSLDKLCAMLSFWKDPLLPSYVEHVYRILNSSSFDEFRFFRETLGFKTDECILCPKPGENGTLIEMMDACFGFVRKKSAGTSLCHPKHELKMFGDQADVDNFVALHSKEIRNSENLCNQYRAGEITDCIRSKGQNEKYDEKAILGRICRHGHPKGFISLKHGERIAYAVYELKRMVEPFKDSHGVDLKCMYDIACILETHLQSNTNYGLEELTERIQFGIPIFHVYAHKSKCQVQYSPRRGAGFGLTDGEGIERLWSYLRKFSYMTKEMRPSRRVDILTEALLHYAKRMYKNQGKALVKSFKRATELRIKTTSEMEQTIMSTPELSSEMVTVERVTKWKGEELALVSTKQNAMLMESTWEPEYAAALWDFYVLRSSIANSTATDEDKDSDNTSVTVAKTRILDSKLNAVEKKHSIKVRWKISDEKFVKAITTYETHKYERFIERLNSLAIERHLQLLLKERYSRGQKQAIRLAKRLSKQTKRMKSELAKYNSRLSVLKDQIPLHFKQITFADAKDPRSRLYSTCKTSIDAGDKVAFSVKRRIIELAELKERCNEEVEMLKSEAHRLLSWRLDKIDELNSLSESFLSEDVRDSRGYSALLKSQILRLKRDITRDKSVFQFFKIDVPANVNESKTLYLAEVVREALSEEAFEESEGSENEDTDSDSDTESDIDSVEF